MESKKTEDIVNSPGEVNERIDDKVITNLSPPLEAQEDVSKQQSDSKIDDTQEALSQFLSKQRSKESFNKPKSDSEPDDSKETSDHYSQECPRESIVDSSLLGLAKQGDTKAIVALMNCSLKSQGISAKATLKDKFLQVMLESAQVPNQQALVAFIRQEIISLESASIQKVKIYGRQTGEEFPAWSEEFEISQNHATAVNANRNSDLSDQVAVGIIKAVFLIVALVFVGQSIAFVFQDNAGDMREFADEAERSLERVKQAQQESQKAQQELCENYPDTSLCRN